MRLVDQADDREIARYDLAENAPRARAVVFGEVFRTDTGWKFRGHGQSYATGLCGIAIDYGFNL